MAKSQNFLNVADLFARDEFSALGALINSCDLAKGISVLPNAKYGYIIVNPTSKVTGEIASIIARNDVVESAKACRLVFSHIISKFATTPAELVSAGTFMDRNGQLMTAESQGDKVVLKYGDGSAAATIKYSCRSELVPIAVWSVVSGELSYDPARVKERPRGKAPGAEVATTSRKKVDKDAASKVIAAKGTRRGGYDPRELASKTRFQLGIMAENECLMQYSAVYSPARMDVPYNKCVPHVVYVASFAHFLHDSPNESYRTMFFERVLPLIRYRFSDFYTIFECHRDASGDNDYLIPESVISEWLNSHRYTSSVGFDVMSYRAWIDKCLDEGAQLFPNVAIYSADMRIRLCNAIEDTREHLGDMIDVMAYVQRVHSTYTNMITSNNLDDVKNILPPALCEYYKRIPLMKLAHDELSFVVEPLIIELFSRRKDAKKVAETFQEIISLIGNVLHSNSSEEIARRTPLSNAVRITGLNGHPAQLHELHSFINSTQFLWTPLTSIEMNKDKYPIANEITRPADGTAIYNVDGALQLLHQRLFAQEAPRVAQANQEIAIKALMGIKPEQMSPQLKELIQSLAK